MKNIFLILSLLFVSSCAKQTVADRDSNENRRDHEDHRYDDDHDRDDGDRDGWWPW